MASSINSSQAKRYAHEDILRKLAFLSTETLKFSKLQIQHAGRDDAKSLVNKTVGARVAHKIRLFSNGTDLSKYILMDTGILNYLLAGSRLLEQKITSQEMGLLLEIFVGIDLITQLDQRDDLFYWKSDNKAQVEYLIKNPAWAALDVKTGRGDLKSLSSCALCISELDIVVKISAEPLKFIRHYKASLPTEPSNRVLPYLNIPHYLCGELTRLLNPKDLDLKK